MITKDNLSILAFTQNISNIVIFSEPAVLNYLEIALLIHLKIKRDMAMFIPVTLDMAIQVLTTLDMAIQVL